MSKVFDVVGKIICYPLVVCTFALWFPIECVYAICKDRSWNSTPYKGLLNLDYDDGWICLIFTIIIYLIVGTVVGLVVDHYQCVIDPKTVSEYIETWEEFDSERVNQAILEAMEDGQLQIFESNRIDAVMEEVQNERDNEKYGAKLKVQLENLGEPDEVSN